MGSCMQLLTLETSNNQRLRRCARRRSKVKPLLLHGCGLHKFHVTDVQNTRNQLQVIEGPNARDKIALSAFHLFLVCDLCKLHTCDACVITNWRLGLRAPLFVRNNSAFLTWLRSAKQGIGFCTLCFCFPTKMLHLNAPFFPLKCSVSPKKSLKFSDNAH